jgi:hypothetical protein
MCECNPLEKFKNAIAGVCITIGDDGNEGKSNCFLEMYNAALAALFIVKKIQAPKEHRWSGIGNNPF